MALNRPLDNNQFNDNQVSSGKTGFTSISKGDTFFGGRNGQEFISKLKIGNPGQFLCVSTDKIPQWVTLSGFLRAGLDATVGNLTVTGTLTVGSLNGVLKATGGLVSGAATTTDLPEGTRLYFTDARVITVIDQQIADGRLSSWYLIEIPYGDFSAAALSSTIDLITLDSGELLEIAKIKSVDFAAPGLTDLSAELGITGKLNKYCKAFDVLNDRKTCRIDNEEGSAIKVTLTSNVNLDTFTGGSLEIRIKTSKEI